MCVNCKDYQKCHWSELALSLSSKSQIRWEATTKSQQTMKRVTVKHRLMEQFILARTQLWLSHILASVFPVGAFISGSPISKTDEKYGWISKDRTNANLPGSVHFFPVPISFWESLQNTWKTLQKMAIPSAAQKPNYPHYPSASPLSVTFTFHPFCASDW